MVDKRQHQSINRPNTRKETNEQKLPQTGNHSAKVAELVGLGLVSMIGLLCLGGMKRKD